MKIENQEKQNTNKFKEILEIFWPKEKVIPGLQSLFICKREKIVKWQNLLKSHYDLTEKNALQKVKVELDAYSMPAASVKRFSF